MLDNVLIALIMRVINAGKATAGIALIPVKQSFQPTVQGVNTQPTAYLYKIGDKRVGSPSRTDRWDEDNEVMVHTELQKYETTFQISGLATQNPNTPNQLTASDICNLISAVLQSSVAIQTFEANEAGIERITQVRNPYFGDDRQQNEASPSFDFVMTHEQIITSTTPIIEGVEFQILSV